uniref:Wound-responsive family protein n=3 Tax=Triticinae TaxID=1648030 RepID=A0A453SUL8_AEGTS
ENTASTQPEHTRSEQPSSVSRGHNLHRKHKTEMSSSAAKKGVSMVVATSMAAVEALKDQAGLCRWDYALRSLYHRAVVTGRRAVPASLSSSSSSQAAVGRAARPRRSEEEKLHKAYHIVCWGPN